LALTNAIELKVFTRHRSKYLFEIYFAR
jgi:hypothetical protein